MIYKKTTSTFPFLENAYDLFDKALHTSDPTLILPEDTFKYISSISDLNTVKSDVLMIGSGKDGIPILKYSESHFTDNLKLLSVNLDAEEIYIKSTNQVLSLKLLPEENNAQYASKKAAFRDLFVLKSLIRYAEPKLIIYICNLTNSDSYYCINHLPIFSYPYNKIPTIGFFLMPFHFEYERKYTSLLQEKQIISKDFTGYYFIDMETCLYQCIEKNIFIDIRTEITKYISNTINLISEITMEILMVKKSFILNTNSIRLYYTADANSMDNYFKVIKDFLDKNSKILKIGLLAPKTIPTGIFVKHLKKWIPKIPLQVKFHEEKGNVLIVFLE